MATKLLLTFCIAFSVFVFSNTERNDGELVSVGVENVFVPIGFDDNDEVVVVLDGYLPDPCHRLSKSVVEINDNQEIKVDQKARQLDGYCPDVTVPYTKVVSIGTLKPGKYKVSANFGLLHEGLPVKEATHALPDDFLYAPVDVAKITKNKKGELLASIEGRYTSNCLSMERIKVIHTNRTIQVLPIMKLADKPPVGESCVETEKAFREKAKLPELEDGRYLLHVRSLNGESKNIVFNPEQIRK